MATMLGSSAPLVLANARLHVEQTPDAFTLTVASLERPTVTQRLDLKTVPWLQKYLKEAEKTRLGALEVGAGGPTEQRVR
jgi:hypothetical protein